MTPRDHRPWAQSPWRHQNHSHEPHEGEGAAVVDVSDPPLHIAEAGGILFLRSSFAVFRLSHDGAGNKNHEWIRPLSSFPAGRRSRENLTTPIYYIFRETSNNTLNFGKLFYFATSQNTWVKILEWRMTQLNCQHSTKSQKLSNGACFHSKMKTKLKLARISKKV